MIVDKMSMKIHPSYFIYFEIYFDVQKKEKIQIIIWLIEHHRATEANLKIEYLP